MASSSESTGGAAAEGDPVTGRTAAGPAGAVRLEVSIASWRTGQISSSLSSKGGATGPASATVAPAARLGATGCCGEARATRPDDVPAVPALFITAARLDAVAAVAAAAACAARLETRGGMAGTLIMQVNDVCRRRGRRWPAAGQDATLAVEQRWGARWGGRRAGRGGGDGDEAAARPLKLHKVEGGWC